MSEQQTKDSLLTAIPASSYDGELWVKASHVAPLLKQMSELRRDALRYRWLRGRSPMADITIECSNSSLAGGVCHLSEEDADTAIDTAMEQQS